jgi:hypothetical protein
MKDKCKCGRAIHISPAGRLRVRRFVKVYPWVTQKDMALLMGVSIARISEIVRADNSRGGK